MTLLSIAAMSYNNPTYRNDEYDDEEEFDEEEPHWGTFEDSPFCPKQQESLDNVVRISCRKHG